MNVPNSSESGEFSLQKRRLSQRIEENKQYKMQLFCRRVAENLIFRAFIFLLIVADLVILLIQIILYPNNIPLTLSSLVLSFIFLMEVSLRIVGLGKVFWTNWINWVDFLVVVLSCCVAIATLWIESSNMEKVKFFLVLMRIIRVPRFIQIIRVVVTERKFLLKSSRLMVSQNKRRFREDGFDLDLCYITDRVIAMSFPSSGLLALYRNPINEVSRFLDTKHYEQYKVYNLCSERTYDPEFFHGRVERILIDDHNVPSLSDMVKFAKDSEEWLSADPENIIVVHCKGGKGRTGTIICTHLINTGAFGTADECLEYFGQKRTDLSIGSKYQGVETPSQSRYVSYFEKVKANSMVLPPPVTLQIHSIIIYSIHDVGRGDGRDFIISITIAKKVIFSLNLFFVNATSKPRLKLEKNILTISEFENPICVEGDVKVSFESKNKSIPTGYEDKPFFFWFNTCFVENNRLFIPRNQLDNLNKPRAWKVFSPLFAVELSFNDGDASDTDIV